MGCGDLRRSIAVLIDPLIDDWDALDSLVAGASGCAGVVRTCHWHQRSIDEVVSRYDVPVWARRDPDGNVPHALDHAVDDRQVLFDRLRIIDAERADEVALWLPHQRAGLTELPVEHVLVSHGPLVLGDGLASLRRATA